MGAPFAPLPPVPCIALFYVDSYASAHILDRVFSISLFLVENPPSLTVPSSNSASFIKCEPIDAEHLHNEPLLSHLKSKTQVNPVKRINIKREHRLDLICSYMNEHPICTLIDLCTAIMLSERDEARIKQSQTIVCLAMNTNDITPNCERIQQFKIELS
ncbi:unnamed protein product [Rotaria sp. Silwood2]|nr:unnamed protein product [Rotaria sp. Silwood2]CAF2902801.1 unnamed protein product [Rotaria sp. Silwood2]CAF3358027.1 unnamed protein product [Rotaria sp. Silwood2]